MSFIDKIKKDGESYNIQDSEARELIKKCLMTEADPTVPSYVKTITEQNINEWNNKSNFSGNYSDLTNIPNEFNPSAHTHKMSDITDYTEPNLSNYALKTEIPTIPTDISAFNNDAGYLTSVPTEYITEAELNNKKFQTESQVNSLIASAIDGIQGITYSIVGSLPSTGEAGVIYLVSNSGTNSNSYDEYIYVNNSFEKIGTTDIDLSNYVQDSDLTAITNSEIDTIWEA